MLDCTLSRIYQNLICQELPSEKDYFSSSDKRLYIDLRDSKGYATELEKLKTDHSNFVLYITFKTVEVKKRDYSFGLLYVWIYVHVQG